VLGEAPDERRWEIKITNHQSPIANRQSPIANPSLFSSKIFLPQMILPEVFRT